MATHLNTTLFLICIGSHLSLHGIRRLQGQLWAVVAFQIGHDGRKLVAYQARFPLWEELHVVRLLKSWTNRHIGLVHDIF